jgi:hypothetical protein
MKLTVLAKEYSRITRIPFGLTNRAMGRRTWLLNWIKIHPSLSSLRKEQSPGKVPGPNFNRRSKTGEDSIQEIWTLGCILTASESRLMQAITSKHRWNVPNSKVQHQQKNGCESADSLESSTTLSYGKGFHEARFLRSRQQGTGTPTVTHILRIDHRI